MAMIHVNRGATSLGAFSEEDVHQGLRAGRFLATDLGWQEGMASWKQLSQFTEFAADVPSSAAPPPPQVGVASTTVPPVAISTAVTNAPRGGLPWEHREERGFFNAFIETLTMVLTKPDQAFNAMKTEGGLVEPLIYALIGGCAGALVSFFFSLLLHGMGLLAGQRDAFTMLAGMGIGAIAFVILIPVFVVLGVFIGAAMIHLSLMIVGGANKSFETTFRVLAFTQGSTGPLQMIPVCGGLIAGIWALIVNCIGLARAHETSTGRAVLAVLLPLILCCGGGCMIAVMIGALAASRH